MPTGYNDASASENFVPVALGGHYAVIKEVAERKTSTGKDMIVVAFDFSAKDQQPNYFSDRFASDTRDDKRWPFNGTMYVMVNDYADQSKTSRNFKTFCVSVEKSNNFRIAWGGSNWAQQFKGKQIGVVYGEVENEYDGRVSMQHRPRWFCSVDSVANAKVPAPRMLSGSAPARQQPKEVPDSFLQVQGNAEDGIPF